MKKLLTRLVEKKLLTRLVKSTEGWKTIVVSVVTAIFSIARFSGWFDADEETMNAITTGLIALIGLFLATKGNRIIDKLGDKATKG